MRFPWRVCLSDTNKGQGDAGPREKNQTLPAGLQGIASASDILAVHSPLPPRVRAEGVGAMELLPPPACQARRLPPG